MWWRIYYEGWVSALPHRWNIYNCLSVQSHLRESGCYYAKTWGCKTSTDSTLTWRASSVCLQGRLYFQWGLVPLEEQTRRDWWAMFFHALDFRVDQQTIPHVQLRNVSTKRLVPTVASIGVLVLSNHEKSIASNVTGRVEVNSRTHNHSIHPDDPLPAIPVPTRAYKVPGGIIGKARYVWAVQTMHQQCKLDRFVPSDSHLELEFFNKQFNGVREDCGKSAATGIKLEVSANRKRFHFGEIVAEASRFAVRTHWKFQYVYVWRTWKTICNVY